MKTIRYYIPAAWLAAGVAMLVVAGSANADDTGRVRLTDFGSETEAVETNADADSDLIIRGASEMRRRNARTSAALRRLFADHDDQPVRMISHASQRPIQQMSGEPYPCPPADCCPSDLCCPATCAAPANYCPSSCCAPPTCCPPEACGCAPEGCCAPTCDSCCAPSCACPPTCDGCCPDTCDGCTLTGHVRITDGFSPCGGDGCPSCLDSAYPRGYSQAGYQQHGNCQQGNCQNGHGNGCRICDSSSCVNKNCVAGFLSTQAAAHRSRNRLASANLNNYLHCKLGYFIHDGNGGVGSPMFGHYSIVYPVDPGYSDDRDGDVYAAQGYGGAVSVPLAPTVRHTYNYGWGIPSSRLTPVSNNVAP